MERQQFVAKPGAKIGIRNKTNDASLVVLDCGPFGSVSITNIIGGVIELVVGDAVPTINIYPPDL